MSKQVRFGIIGSGMMGREHIRNLRLLPNARLTALADPVASSLDSALAEAADPAVKTYDSAQALAASGKVDAVIVASPNFTHREVLEPLFAAEYGELEGRQRLQEWQDMFARDQYGWTFHDVPLRD